MKYRIHPLLCLGLLAAALAGQVRATEPDASAPHEAVPLARTGKVLLLDNESLLQGNIERVEDQYRIRRLTGETGVPADRVIFVGQAPEDAYRFLRSRANLNDADERLRLAHWCRQNGMHNLSLEEVRAAIQLRPDHPASRDLISYLQHATAQAKAEPRRKAEPPPPPPVDLTSEATNTFATRIQPILMNTCASCHATEKNTSRFRLTRVWSSGSSNRAALQYNLAAVLAQVNVQQPELSKLLTRAVIDHGRVGQPPMRDRQCPPYRALEDWVHRTVENNPHLREQSNAPPPVETQPAVGAVAPPPSWGSEPSPKAAPLAIAPPSQSPSAAPLPLPTVPVASTSGPQTVPVPPSTAPTPAPPRTEAAGPPRSSRSPEDDVVDPDEFNRIAHPERTSPLPPGKPAP